MNVRGPNRRRRLLDLVEAAGHGALLVTQRANVRYLTGFTGSSGWAFVGAAGTALLTDVRYHQQAVAEAPDCDLVIAEDGLTSALTPLLERIEAPVAFESSNVSVSVWKELGRVHDGVEWCPSLGLVEQLRVAKDPGEVDAVRRALEVAESALEETVAALEPGTSEVSLAAALEHACRVRGAERMAFDTIVAAGARGAMPHARPTQRLLRSGDLVVVDMGCVVDGYCSDITRAVYVGAELPARWHQVHAALVAARGAALAVAKAGVTTKEVDSAAREVLEQHKLGDAFVHSLGHGVGLEVHEAPRLAQRSDEVLAAGAVVTIEPGVYLPGDGGMRLEDLALVTEAGAEVLNRLPLAPMSVPA